MRFYIGHPAYNGANRQAIVDDKAAAAEELRKRGVSRENALNAIERATLGMHVTTRSGNDVIELKFV